jgi:tetratricopeptide (TPR) repeat protein
MASDRTAVALALFAAVVATSPVARASCAAGTAQAAYQSARQAYDEKRFEDAVALLRQAYACDPDPVYLGNIARAYEEASRSPEALAAWQAYLGVITDPEERRRTEGRISALTKVVAERERLELERQQAEEARRLAEAQAHLVRPVGPSSPGPRIATGAWLTMGAGLVGLAGGVALGVLADARHSSAVSEPRVTTADSLQGTARNFATAANVAFVAGGVVAAAGLVWIGVDVLRTGSGRGRVALALSPWGFTLAGTL